MVADFANIRAISEMISEVRETDKLLKLIVRALVEKTGYDRVLVVCKKAGGGLVIQEEAGLPSCEIAKFEQSGESFCDKILEKNEPVCFLPESPQRQQIELLLGCASLAAVPIRRKWILLAGNNIHNRPLTTEDLELISTLTRQVSVGLENIELYETLRKERDELRQAKANVENHAKMTIRANLELTQKEERLSRKVSGFSILYAIGQLIGRTHEIKELLTLVTESLVVRLDYDRSLILEQRQGRIVIHAQVGFSVEEIERVENQTGPFLSKAMTEGKALLLTSQGGCREIEPIFGCTSLIIVPLQGQEFLIAGKCVVYDALNSDDLETLTILASQVKIAMENVALYQQLRQERDQLQQAKRDLEEWSQILEQRVEERTRKLQETQNQLMQAGRLAAVGQLGAGVAHELNNPLGGVLGYAQLSLEKLEQIENAGVRQQLQRYLQVIEEETNRCKQIIGGLLRFSRSGIQEKPIYQTTSIPEVLEHTLKLTQYQLKMHNVTLIKEIDPGLPSVTGDANQLQQVFTNMILNADQAMPKGGELRITVTKNSDKPGMIAIRFQDKGCGIAPEHLDKIFDPFFTTKAIGQGTGLGLSISYGIIQDHKGQVSVTSEVSKGTVFTIYLPTGTTGGST